MTRFSEKALTWAFIAFRNSLPPNHERKVKLANVVKLRYDKVTPGIVHLVQSDGSDFYRRLPKLDSLEAIAENLVLFPVHMIVTFKAEGKLKDFVLNLSSIKRFRLGLYDIFALDNENVNIGVISFDMKTQAQNLVTKFQIYASKHTDMNIYLVGKLAMLIDNMYASKSNLLDLSRKFHCKFNQRLKTDEEFKQLVKNIISINIVKQIFPNVY